MSAAETFYMITLAAWAVGLVVAVLVTVLEERPRR